LAKEFVDAFGRSIDFLNTGFVNSNFGASTTKFLPV
jgi:hypothetical protein